MTSPISRTLLNLLRRLRVSGRNSTRARRNAALRQLAMDDLRRD